MSLVAFAERRSCFLSTRAVAPPPAQFEMIVCYPFDRADYD